MRSNRTSRVTAYIAQTICKKSKIFLKRNAASYLLTLKCPLILQTFLSLMKDDGDEDVRNNAVFGLGELAMHGGPATQAHYPEMLQALSSLVQREESPKVIDQVGHM